MYNKSKKGVIPMALLKPPCTNGTDADKKQINLKTVINSAAVASSTPNNASHYLLMGEPITNFMNQRPQSNGVISMEYWMNKDMQALENEIVERYFAYYLNDSADDADLREELPKFKMYMYECATALREEVSGTLHMQTIKPAALQHYKLVKTYNFSDYFCMPD